MRTITQLRAAMLACFALQLAWPEPARANDIAQFQILYNTDFVTAGVGGLRDVGSGVITLGGISGTITRAYLYWNGPMNSTNPAADAAVLVNNQPVAGLNIGFSSANCWTAYLPPQGLNVGQSYR